MRSRSVSLSLLVCVSVLSVSVPGAALAWDVAIGTNSLDVSLFVGSGSGAAPTWTTIDERVYASDVPGPTVPNNWLTQTWDQVAEMWPNDVLEDFSGVTQASIYNDDLDVEFWGSAEAFVFGAVSPGDAVGAAIAYDFELILEPFTTANVVLDPFETYVFLESSPGDVGTAFAQARLYQTDVGINDPGGINMPLASDNYSVQAGDPPVDAQPSFSSPFVNSTSSPVTYNLRFEANVSVLEVPEPALGASIWMGVLLLAGLREVRRTR